MEREGSLALVVHEAPEQTVGNPRKPASCPATLKSRRLACVKAEHSHLRKKKFKGCSRKREQYGIDADSGALHNVHRSKVCSSFQVQFPFLIISKCAPFKSLSDFIAVDVPKSVPFGPTPRSVNSFSRVAAMTVLRRVEDTQASALRCRRMFRLLIRQQPNPRCRGEVQLESALYLINQGDREAAYNELRPIADGPLFRDDPVVNLCHGLNTHCLWYEAAVAENMKQDVTQVRADSEGRSSGPHEFIGETEAPEPSVGVSSRPTENRLLREGSPEGSIISSDSHFYRSAGQQSERASQLAVDFEVSLWEASQRSIYEETNDEGFVEDGEQVWLKASIPLTAELDRRLFPLRVIPKPGQQDQHYRVPMNDGRTRDLHAAAVKHLKQALMIAPDTLPALLPLVQLLLAVHDIKGAIYEIDRCAEALMYNITPLSIKAVLLESLKHKDHSLLQACYRKVLSLNPFAVWALKGLINLHASGKLEQEVLLDHIALHLDATTGSAEIWRKLASIFLGVSDASGIPLLEAGTNTENTNTGQEKVFSVGSREYVQMLWASPRHEWWLRKHFCSDLIIRNHQQQNGGERWLIAHMAACAAHIYGPQFHLVEKICKFLEKRGEDTLHKFVGRHRQKSLKLFAEEYRGG
ncbi:hypothetical protein AXG93_2886s1220 [Marchantia polymorpha subsp. ruderalis]|uniref:Uncharacterized protein n=1 Tax=Marchantia polymorpha subsp. ruderalis TaxID=1480154 RepID=A0A176WN15_MARPO|nr:hypothetical protein AXG93_2886s1220 [Marchantia polymorpha subsp. ruderalis]